LPAFRGTTSPELLPSFHPDPELPAPRGQCQAACGQGDHGPVPQLHPDPRLGGESGIYSVNHKNKLREGVTIQESYIFTVLPSETLEPVHSLQVNLCRSRKLHYPFLIKENVNRQIRQKFIIFRYKDFLNSVNPPINNSDLL